MPSDTYILTISDAGVSVPATDSVTNASVAAGAAIAFSKLASLTSGNILVGSSANVPTSVALTGDVTVSNTGVAAIASGAIVNADVNASAAIAHSKLASMSSGNILVGSSGTVPTSVAVTGDITVSSSGVTAIASDAVTFAKMQNVSGYTILGKPTTGSGDAAEIGSSSFMLESSTGFLRQADASTARSTLGLGTLATLNSLTVGTGGTGQTSYAIGDILYASGSTTLSKLASGAANTVLRSTGLLTAPSYGQVALTTDVTGTLPAANGGTGVTTSTGSGANALATSPTLVTPILGTPTSGTLTSCTGLPLTTGVTGTLPVANGGTGVTNSTGSGANALATSPTLITPILGTPTSGTLTSCTGLPLTTGVTGTLPVANGGTGNTQSAYGEYYISTIAATPIVTAGSYVKVAGTTTAGTLSNFTHTSGNRLTYTGTATRKFFVSATISFHGTNGTDYAFAIGKNNNIITASIVEQTGEGAADLSSVSVQCIVELANTEFIEVFTTSMTGPNNPTVDHMNVVAIGLI